MQVWNAQQAILCEEVLSVVCAAFYTELFMRCVRCGLEATQLDKQLVCEVDAACCSGGMDG